MEAAELSIGSRLDWINLFIRLCNNVSSNIKETSGLNITQARIIFCVSLHEAPRIGSVGAALAIKPSSMTAALSPLDKNGYTDRSFSESDRRHIFINITEKGAEIALHYIDAVCKAFVEDCPPVFDEKRDELRGLLLPPCTHVLFGIDGEDTAAIATRIAHDLKLDQDQEETIQRITKVLIIESIAVFLSKMAEFERKHDISPNEERILRALGNGVKDVNLKELSQLLNIRPNVTSLSIRTLTDRRLIARTPSKKDIRAAHVKLTRKGERLVYNTKGELCELFDACFTGLAERAVSEFFPR